MKSRAKVEPGSGKHTVSNALSEGPKLRYLLEDENERASCRRRAGTIVPTAEHFGDLITTDHKIFSEESESRKNHRYAVWHKIWQRNGYNPTHAKQKLPKKHKSV